MDKIKGLLAELADLSPVVPKKLILSVVVVLLVLAMRRLTLYVIAKNTEDIQVRYRVKKTTAYVAYVIAMALLGWVWFEGFGTLAAYLGIVSAGIAIALKEPLVNLAGWAFILWRKPFDVGDRVSIGGHAGDVIDTRIFQFTLMEIGNWVAADQSTGRVIHIPNGKVFNETLANYTKGFQHIWNEIAVLVTFESDWEKAKRILLEIGERHAGETDVAKEQIKRAARTFMIFYNELTPAVYTTVVDSGVLLTLRYLCHARARRGSTEAVWEAILRAFRDCGDIDFAYPTQRFYSNIQEGKPGAATTTPASEDGGEAG